MHSQPGSSLTPLTQRLPARTRAAVEIVGLLLVVGVVGLAMNNLGLFATKKLDGFFNDWVYCGVEVLAATLVLARALLVRQERGAWLMLALGIGFYAAGDIYYTLVIERLVNPPSRSPSDAAYLLFEPSCV